MPHFIFIQQISVLNILNMLYNLHLFSSKCRLFHIATLFGFCITHILNTGCAKIWKKEIRRQKVKLDVYLSWGMRVLATFLFHDATSHSRPGYPHYRGFSITLRHTTISMTPLDGWSARRRDLYLTTHNTHNRQTSSMRDSNPQSQHASGCRRMP